MAVNIIDALVTTLTLDVGGFLKGKNDALKAQGEIKDRGKAMADAVSASNQRLASSFTTVRNEVAGLLLTLAGARTIKDFVGNIITGDAATGRLATNLGIATEQLSAWEGAIGRVGGNAKSADAALQAMVSTVQDFKLTGNSANAADLMGLGVNRFNDPTEMLLQIAQASQHMSRPEFAARAGRLGFDQDTINLLAKGRDGVQQLLDQQKQLGVTTDANAKSAQAFQDAMSRLESAIKGAARPAIEGLTQDFDALANDKHGLDDFFSGVASGLHTISTGFRVAKAGLADFVTIWHQLRAGDFAGALNTFLHGSVESVGDQPSGPAAPDGRSVAQFRAAGFPGYQGGEAWRGGKPLDNADLDAGFAALKDKIKRSESNGNYNSVAYNLRSPKPVTEMTLGELFQWQRTGLRAMTRGRRGPHDIGSTGVGAYAFESLTLADQAAKVFGENWRSQMFSPSVQDKLANHLYGEVKGNPRKLANAWNVFGNPRMMHAAGGSRSSTVTIGSMTIVSPNPKSFANTDLADALRNRGLVVQADRGVTP